jgi:hypothetical protein
LSDTKVIEFKIEGDRTKTEVGVGTYRMEFDYNELVAAEVLAGCNLTAFSGGMSATQTRAHVFAALRKHHPDIALHEAGSLLTKDQAAVMAALSSLYGASAVEEGAIAE